MSPSRMSAIFGFLLMGAAAALIVTFYPDAMPALRRGNRAAMAFDAVVALLAAAGMALLLHQFQGILVDRFHAQARALHRQPGHHRQRRPRPRRAGRRGPRPAHRCRPARPARAAGLAADEDRGCACAAALLALCATIPGQVRTPGEFLLHYAISLAMAAGGIAFCWFFARRNYLAYALVFWLMALRTPMLQLRTRATRR